MGTTKPSIASDSGKYLDFASTRGAFRLASHDELTPVPAKRKPLGAKSQPPIPNLTSSTQSSMEMQADI
jgi:hypothetical protein